MHVPIGAEKLAYSLTEACAATSLGKTTLYGHIAAGRLAAIKIGGRTVIPADSLRALLQSQELAKPSETIPRGAAIEQGTTLDGGEGHW